MLRVWLDIKPLAQIVLLSRWYFKHPTERIWFINFFVNQPVLENFTILQCIPPAENTFVGTGEAGCGLHTPVRFNAVKGVFVASSSSSHHRLWTRWEGKKTTL